MTYLIDTDWIVDWLADRPAAIALLRQLSNQGLSLSLITYGEIYEGIYYGRNRDRMEEIFNRFLQDVELIGLDEETMRIFARIRGTLRQRGTPAGDDDILIAATAIRNDQVLVSRNIRDFERIPGLVLYDLNQ